jgi:hypothetical protein
MSAAAGTPDEELRKVSLKETSDQLYGLESLLLNIPSTCGIRLLIVASMQRATNYEAILYR